MPFRVIRDDITKVQAEAIVCATDENFSASGSADQQVRKCAGAELDRYCDSLDRLGTGEAVLAPSFEMINCEHIIFVRGPVYNDSFDAFSLLKKSYENVLGLAVSFGVESIAMPLISTGAFGYPKKEAMKIALMVIEDHLKDYETDVTLLVYDPEAYLVSKELCGEVEDYLRDHYYPRVHRRLQKTAKISSFDKEYKRYEPCEPEFMACCSFPDPGEYVPDESFNECLLRLINEKGLIESDIWKAANLDRKTFNQIRNNKKANPKKETVLAICIGMKLDIREAEDLLEKAGYALGSSKFDWVMRFFLEHHYYDIMEINLYLFKEDLKLLGSSPR